MDNKIDKQQPLCQQYTNVRKKQSKSTNKYDKKNNMMFYNTGLAFNRVKLNNEKDVKKINNKLELFNKGNQKQEFILTK